MRFVSAGKASGTSRRNLAWRVGGLVAAIGAGYLFFTSASASHGVDLRASSVSDLGALLTSERSNVDALNAQLASLTNQISALTRDQTPVGSNPTLDAAREDAGYEALSGPGVTVTLNDAPKDVIRTVTASGVVPVDALVVHQQDIQAVVNALWAGGAQGISVQGVRLTSTTGIKCVGNTVVLHGVPYAPPYVIQAVGDPNALVGAISSSEYVSAYQTFVQQYHLGWSLTTAPSITLVAASGSGGLSYAKVLH